MMFRVVARISFALTLAAALCFSSAAQTAGTPSSSTSSSSSLNSSSSSNDLASLYGAPVVQIVARVNDRVITNSDITRAQQQIDQEAHQNNWSLDQYNHSEKNLLRDLIDQQLLLSKGKQLGITGDTDLIKRLDEIRKQNHLDSLDDLEKAVEQQGISYEDFKANIRNSIVTQQVVRDQVGSKLQISQAEIEKYYNAHQDSYTQPESVHLNEILIPTSENPSNAELATAEAKAKEVEAKLKAGGNFADLAKKYSGGPTAQQGGDLGRFKRGALAKVLEEQTFALPNDGYTEPIRTKQGYIILQATDHVPGGVAPLQKVEPDIEQALYLQMIEPAVRRYLTRLREEAYIDIRPGYVDSAASPNETKPTFAAYAPPQPKKKKKKARFDRRVVRYDRGSRKRKTAPVTTASAASTGAATGSAPAAATSATAGSGAASTRTEQASIKKPTLRKNKREKFRFGHAPDARVSDEQVATTANGNGQTTASAQTDAEAEAAVASGEKQALGEDLEHTPTITAPKQQKTRFSDVARNKADMDARKNEKHKKKGLKKVKKVKQDNAKASPLSATEQANQQVQSAPLGLDGSTATKKKAKKVKVKGGEKTRMSDTKKNKNDSSSPPAPASNSSTQQPQ